MPRVARVSPGGMIFHCLNRGNDRRAVFDDSGDYAAFERVLEKTLELVPIRLLAYCLMPITGTWCCGRERMASLARSCSV